MQVYEGNEKYIFVSYAHKDSHAVLPIVEAMAEQGFRIWYDSGIEAGTEWPEYIGERLAHCDCVLAFMSPAAAASENCRNEIHLACHLKKNILVAYIEDTELSFGLALQIGAKQSIYRAKHPSMLAFAREICEAKILEACSAFAIVTETMRVRPSLQFEEKNGRYIVTGIGACTETELVIPREVDGVPVVEIGRYAFKASNHLTALTIEEGIITIGDFAFHDCTALVRVNLPKTLAFVNSWAFRGCKSLTTVELGDNIRSLQYGAFYECAALTSITLPKSIDKLDYYTFEGCKNLKTITFKGTKAEWQAIPKHDRWKDNTGYFTVVCTDGTISKANA